MRILILLLFILNFFCAKAQVPSWTWAKNAQGISYDGAASIATDSDGNVYVTGYFYGASITFGSYTLNNNNPNKSDFFLVKYDPSGAVLWARSAGDTDEDGGYSVTVDASDNVYVTGYFFSGFIAFDSFTLFNLGSYDMFIVKYDSLGSVLWAQSAGDIGDDYGRSVITDDFDNVYVTGSFQSPNLNFGASSLINSDVSGVTRDLYIVKYDSAGTFQWAISAGGTNEEYSRALAMDPSGNICLAGNFNSPLLVIGSDTLVNAGFYDMFLLKINQNGNFIWALSGGGNGIDYGNSIAIDILGNVFVSGGFASQVNYFGPATLLNSGNFNMYLVKYNSSGNYVWARKSGGTGSDDGYDVATDHAGNILVAGYFTSPLLVFGASTLTNNGATDVYVVKYDPIGTELWAKSAGNIQDDIGICVAVNNNDVYVAGYFRSTSINFAATLINSGGDDTFLAKIGEFGTGITEENFSDHGVFPNPAKDYIQVSGENIQTLKIYDISGRLVQSVSMPVPKTIDIRNLPEGIYPIAIETKQGTFYKKVVVTR